MPIPSPNDPKTRWPNFSMTKLFQSPFLIPWVLSAKRWMSRHIAPIKMANSSEWFTFEETKIDIDHRLTQSSLISKMIDYPLFLLFG